mmetsp:Transcript_10747/g.19996  ORF Transcript_10747/g.19996 Transcript_10747/m.19996 type:complete len:649 (-) Transcript_10747:2-1948(-)
MLASGFASLCLVVLVSFQVSGSVVDASLNAEELAWQRAEDVQHGTCMLQAGSSNMHTVRQDANIVHSSSPLAGHQHQVDNLLSLSHETVKPTKKTAHSTHKDTAHSSPFTNAEFEKDLLRDAKIIASVTFSLVIIFVCMHFMHEKDMHFLPEQAVVVIFGILMGLILKCWAHADLSMFASDRAFLGILLLPPIVFESGYSMRRLDFMSQLQYVLIFAMLGSLISISVVGALLYQSGRLGLHGIQSVRSCLIISTIVSTTDPVATLGAYAHLHVDPLLNTIVFGEAALNDVLAVVVFSILNYDGARAFDQTFLKVSVEGFLHGARVMFGSLLIGIAVTVIICKLLRSAQLHKSKKVEILMMLIASYFSFAAGELSECSGIISTLFTGILLHVYAEPHLSVQGSVISSFVLHEACTVIDASIFLLCGTFSVFAFGAEDGVVLGCWLMLSCTVARVCSTLPCGWLSNYNKRQFGKTHDRDEADMHLLSSKHLFMVWHAGLRGAVSLWLSFHIGDWMDDVEIKGTRLAVQRAVLLLIVVFILVFGGTTRPCLRLLQISMGHDHAEDELSKTEMPFTWESALLHWMHTHVFAPFLISEAVASEAKREQSQDIEDVLSDGVYCNRRGSFVRRYVPEGSTPHGSPLSALSLGTPR